MRTLGLPPSMGIFIMVFAELACDLVRSVARLLLYGSPQTPATGSQADQPPCNAQGSSSNSTPAAACSSAHAAGVAPPQQAHVSTAQAALDAHDGWVDVAAAAEGAPAPAAPGLVQGGSGGPSCSAYPAHEAAHIVNVQHGQQMCNSSSGGVGGSRSGSCSLPTQPGPSISLSTCSSTSSSSSSSTSSSNRGQGSSGCHVGTPSSPRPAHLMDVPAPALEHLLAALQPGQGGRPAAAATCRRLRAAARALPTHLTLAPEQLPQLLASPAPWHRVSQVAVCLQRSSVHPLHLQQQLLQAGRQQLPALRRLQVHAGVAAPGVRRCSLADVAPLLHLLPQLQGLCFHGGGSRVATLACFCPATGSRRRGPGSSMGLAGSRSCDPGARSSSSSSSSNPASSCLAGDAPGGLTHLALHHLRLVEGAPPRRSRRTPAGPGLSSGRGRRGDGASSSSSPITGGSGSSRCGCHHCCISPPGPTGLGKGLPRKQLPACALLSPLAHYPALSHLKLVDVSLPPHGLAGLGAAAPGLVSLELTRVRQPRLQLQYLSSLRGLQQLALCGLTTAVGLSEAELQLPAGTLLVRREQEYTAALADALASLQHLASLRVWRCKGLSESLTAALPDLPQLTALCHQDLHLVAGGLPGCCWGAWATGLVQLQVAQLQMSQLWAHPPLVALRHLSVSGVCRVPEGFWQSMAPNLCELVVGALPTPPAAAAAAALDGANAPPAAVAAGNDGASPQGYCLGGLAVVNSLTSLQLLDCSAWEGLRGAAAPAPMQQQAAEQQPGLQQAPPFEAEPLLLLPLAQQQQAVEGEPAAEELPAAAAAALAHQPVHFPVSPAVSVPIQAQSMASNNSSDTGTETASSSSSSTDGTDSSSSSTHSSRSFSCVCSTQSPRSAACSFVVGTRPPKGSPAAAAAAAALRRRRRMAAASAAAAASRRSTASPHQHSSSSSSTSGNCGRACAASEGGCGSEQSSLCNSSSSSVDTGVSDGITAATLLGSTNSSGSVSQPTMPAPVDAADPATWDNPVASAAVEPPTPSTTPTPEQLLSSCPELRALVLRCCGVRRLALGRLPAGSAALSQLPTCCCLWRRLEDLSLQDMPADFTSHHLTALVSPHVTSLTRLTLSNCPAITWTGLEALPPLPSLRHLAITGCSQVTVVAVQGLLAGCPRLEEVHLAGLHASWAARSVRSDPLLARHLAQVFTAGAYWSTHSSWRCGEVGWVRPAGISLDSNTGSNSGSNSGSSSGGEEEGAGTAEAGGQHPSNSSSSSNGAHGGEDWGSNCAEAGVRSGSAAAGCWGAASSRGGTCHQQAPARHPLAWARCHGLLPSAWGGLGCLRPVADMDMEPPLDSHDQQQQAGVQRVDVTASVSSGAAHPVAQQAAAAARVDVCAAAAATASQVVVPSRQEAPWRAPRLFDAAGHLEAQSAGEPAWEAWYFAVGPADRECLLQAAPQLRLLHIA